MKIAILGHSKFPLKEPYAGGLEMILHLLARELTLLNHEVDVYALSGSDEMLNCIELDSDAIPKKIF